MFEDPTRPLVVDLGCGAGRYVLLMAVRKGPGKNYLGVDVHKALLERANSWAAARSLSGYVHYLQANAVVSAGALLGSYPGPVELASIQYPDPQQRRQRHIVGQELVEALATVLSPGARVYLASDFEDTAAFMRNAFERYGPDSFKVDDVHATQPVFPCASASALVAAAAVPFALKSFPAETTAGSHSNEAAAGAAGPVREVCSGVHEGAMGSGMHVDGEDLLRFEGSWQEAGWLVENPVGAPTEREVYVEKATKGRVYRAVLVRT